jgi:hypothetical protein
MPLEKRDVIIWLLEWPVSRTLITPNVEEDVEQQELSFIAGEDERWYSQFGKLFGNFLQNQAHFYYVIQQSCSLVFIQGSWKFIAT